MNEVAILEMMGLYSGKILSPAESGELLRAMGCDSTVGLGLPNEHYALLATVSQRMAQLFAKGSIDVGSRLTVYKTQYSQVLIVLTVQVGYCQARILFDLHDPVAQRYFAELKESDTLPVLFQATDNTCIYEMLLSPGKEHYAPVMKIIDEHKPPSDFERLHGLAETAATLAQNLDQHRINGMPIEEVSVTTVLPKLEQPLLQGAGKGGWH